MEAQKAPDASSSFLSTYQANAQERWEDLYRLGMDLWEQVMREQREEGAARPETKAAWRQTITTRRNLRPHTYRTAADVARRVFNIIAGRAALNGLAYDIDAVPDPESFKTLRDVRLFLMQEMERLHDALRARRPSVAYSLPVLPKGEGLFFSGNGEDTLTQKVHIPDLEGGVSVTLTTETAQGQRYVCLGGSEDPTRLRVLLPRLATILSQRLFGQDDPQDLHFFVHHPVGVGPKGHEQYWNYDVRSDLSGIFHMAGRRLMATLPHAVAYPAFPEDRPDRVLVLEPDTRVTGGALAFESFIDRMQANGGKASKLKPH